VSKLAKWSRASWSTAGVKCFSQFGAAQVIHDGGRVGGGVITEDKGRDKDGQQGTTSPRMSGGPTITVLANGTRLLTGNISLRTDVLMV